MRRNPRGNLGGQHFERQYLGRIAVIRAKKWFKSPHNFLLCGSNVRSLENKIKMALFHLPLQWALD